MLALPQQILDLIERMEARKEKGFRVSPQTARSSSRRYG